MNNILKNTSVRVEASSACQLKCPACPTARGIIKNEMAGTGALSLTKFEEFLKYLPNIKSVEFSNYGEVFLNKEFINILELCHKRGIIPNLRNGVNLNNVSSEQLEALILYGVDTITVSIDGVSQETYQKYRVRGNIATVINNIKKINSYKKIHQKDTPHLIWQFIVFEHNFHEIDTAYSMSEKLEMDFFLKNDWTGLHSSKKYLSKIESYSKNLKESTIFNEYQLNHNADLVCSQLWNAPQINWNGMILGCCVNFWADLGTLGEDLSKFERTKNMLLGIEPFNTAFSCLRCDIFYQKVLQRIWWKNIFNINLYRALFKRIFKRSY
jgi:MoaA/NifB/PqqE/SkfB family radical SAM enzyme